MKNFCYILCKKISLICENDYKFFLNKPNVFGIGLGYKIKKGFCTFEKCIKIFTSKKIPNKYLSYNNLIPKTYKGIKTDIIESTPFKFYSLTDRIRPVLGGYSIGPSTVDDAGTMACLVKDNTYYYILGSNHILAQNNIIPIGTSILQPGISDGGNPSTDIVALLSKYIPLKFNDVPNYADCAIARIPSKTLVSSKIAFIGYPKKIATPKLHKNVLKVGNTTELTRGLITAINGTFETSFEGHDVLFKHLIITTTMGEKGDSGALLLDNSNHSLGLLCGGSDSCTVYNNIKDVLKELNVSIVTD